MTTTEPENPQPRPAACCETGFWAFLEYPVFWVPVVAGTVLGVTALLIFAIVS